MGVPETSNANDWDAPPLPIAKASILLEPARPRRQVGLRHLMIAVVYFAILSWLGRGAMQTDEVLAQTLFGIMIGLGLIGTGAWGVLKLGQWALIGWVFFVVGYMMVTTVTIGGFSLPALPLLIGSIIYLHGRRRATNQDALLWVLSLAAERRMPLAPGVFAFSGQVSGIFRVWAESLADLLNRGSSPPSALEVLPKVLPKEAVVLIRVGQDSGDLARGLREAAELRTRDRSVLKTFGTRVAYLCWVLFAGQSVVGFVLYFIMPKYEAIFYDFGFQLPPITRQVLLASHVVVDAGPLLFLAQLGVFLYLNFAFVGWANWNVPLIDRLFWRRHSTLILRALAVAVESGRPIVPALRALGQSYPTRWVRRKLEDAGEFAARGTDWSEAMLKVGLLTAGDAGVVASARRVGNLPWALRELAETAERRFGYRIQVWSQFLFVAAMLVMGLMVLVISMAYFTPLTTLIARLSE